MSVRRLSVLQWVGLLAGALAWAVQHVVGWGITAARCNPGGSGWGVGLDVWQGALLGATAVVLLGAEAAAIAVLRATRGTDDAAEAPPGRLHFFAVAAAVANPIFLAIVLLDGIGSIVSIACRQG